MAYNPIENWSRLATADSRTGGGFGMGMSILPGGSGSGSGSVSGGGVPNAGVPGNIADITALINKLNLQAQQNANAARIPNAAGLEEASSANIADELAGKVPADVIRLLSQQGAERGVGRGISGSPNEMAAYLQALGLTSLDLMKTGQTNLSAALGRNKAADTFDPTGLILTPYQESMLANQAKETKLREDALALEKWKAQNEEYRYDKATGPKEYSYKTTSPYTGEENWLYHYWK